MTREVSELEQQVAARPADPEVPYRLGLHCNLLGKPDLATSWYRSALACDAGHTGAHSRFAALGRRRCPRGSPGALSLSGLGRRFYSPVPP
jgi:hypothetical protein